MSDVPQINVGVLDECDNWAMVQNVEDTEIKNFQGQNLKQRLSELAVRNLRVSLWNTCRFRCIRGQRYRMTCHFLLVHVHVMKLSSIVLYFGSALDDAHTVNVSYRLLPFERIMSKQVELLLRTPIPGSGRFTFLKQVAPSLNLIPLRSKLGGQSYIAGRARECKYSVAW